MSAFDLQIDDDGFALLTFDLPGEKVNKLSSFVMEELARAIETLERSAGVRSLLLQSGKSDIFIAGADVREIENVGDADGGRRASKLGQELFERFARLPFTTTAAIHGACLGGGTELALACDYRVISDGTKTRIGLPEVQLGILPAWGGTQRLPRLVGIRAGLDLILTGRTLDGRRAGKIGLADAVVPSPIFSSWAQEFARGKTGTRKPRPHTRSGGLTNLALERNPAGRALVFRSARDGILKKTHGHYPAPLEALAAVEEGWGKAMPEALAIENRHFGNLIGTPVQKNLLRIFFWSEEIKKETGVDGGADRGGEVTHVGVLGAGVMGGGIAQLAADRGLPVRMKDIAPEALGHGYAAASRVWEERIRRRRMSRRDYQARMALISGGLDYAGFPLCEVTIEAVVEKLSVKQTVLAEWEDAVSDASIFASNTSTLPIRDIAARARHPERVIGMHFFNPVHRMPLVEVIRSERTSEDVTATVFSFARSLGKTPVVVKDAPGFLVNRVLAPYLSEALRLLREGIAMDVVDAAMEKFGMPVGPIALLDDVGIDVAVKGGHTMAAAFPERLPLAEGFDALPESGRFGRKSRKGFYRYQGGSRKGPDPEAYRILGVEPARPASRPPEEIVERLVLPMINEAAFCLMESIVPSPAKLDLAMIFGTGFPAFRGGLLRYADVFGLDRVAARLEALREALGPRFSPAPLIQDLARWQGKFYTA
jgi:3-hydroxyacyl-CoA dehydrogenase / enoyl-CoA hydratase / 3-hydroxybutyryl-CoA epimerase